ncbi:MAG: hypothetical protein V7767_16200, partial [Leeuwenhoekiella sp.]
GMQYAAKVSEIYKQAQQLAPGNPRVVFSKAEWDMGSASFFGQDTAPFCKDIERALELFNTFKNDEPFYPKWGEDRAKEAMKSCKA